MGRLVAAKTVVRHKALLIPRSKFVTMFSLCPRTPTYLKLLAKRDGWPVSPVCTRLLVSLCSVLATSYRAVVSTNCCLRRLLLTARRRVQCSTGHYRRFATQSAARESSSVPSWVEDWHNLAPYITPKTDPKNSPCTTLSLPMHLAQQQRNLTLLGRRDAVQSRARLRAPQSLP